METLVSLALGLGLIVAVFRYLASGESEEDPHLTVRIQARIKRLERYKRLPEPVFEMTAPEFEEYIADLCRRDGCTDVQRVRGDTLGGQITGYLPDGRKAALKRNRECGDRPVDAHSLRTFDDAARAQLGAEVTILVVLGPLNKHARRTAARRGLTLIDVDRLESWMRGTTLSALLAPRTGRSGTNRTSAHD
ncbi:restriction endonuclease [Kitasatospora sp. NPDC085879]|jgi:restriction system protein|uniref:restriction endonuclease n=1 Tax=Kitasatospora sp. NPDC085879 TaxID=3154769 RepID=UPI00343F7246